MHFVISLATTVWQKELSGPLLSGSERNPLISSIVTRIGNPIGFHGIKTAEDGQLCTQYTDDLRTIRFSGACSNALDTSRQPWTDTGRGSEPLFLLSGVDGG